MAEALFGLIGVVIGGLITAGVEERRRRADARNRRRVAARAIHTELLSALSAIVTALEEQDTRSLVAGRHVGDAGAAWREHGAGLGDISVKDWILISQAVVAADSFPWAWRRAPGERI